MPVIQRKLHTEYELSRTSVGYSGITTVATVTIVTIATMYVAGGYHPDKDSYLI